MFRRRRKLVQNILRQRQRGVALIIVLAFVVIITGVILAYFSRSLTNREVSDSSANQTKVDSFAQGVTKSIIGNLRQEIAEPSLSSTTTVTTGNVTTTIYTPKTPASMLPLQAVGISSTAANLLIRSGTGLFLDGTSGKIAENAIAVSSTTPSLNGRFISMANWNAHYLLPLAANAVDSTPAAGSFTAPDWILVARNGLNPTKGDPSLISSATNSTSVIGRYAYAIYHEGGLLDANVAGYPSVTNTNQFAYKPALAYADLTQIGLTNPQIDSLVGWRNYATGNAQGAFPSFSFSSGTTYFNSILGNQNGFMRISGTATNPSNGQSDHFFQSRQELIAFMSRGLGLSGTSLGILNYLGTFTRDLNQPSFAPDLNRPKILNSTQGGNNAAPDLAGAPLDDKINPRFLTVRVENTTPKGRNDGADLIAGEPLVKKRFALSRLAWLTYAGPIANDKGTALNPGNDAGVSAIIAKLEGSYGFTDGFLKQGTANNIKRYFGLEWKAYTDPVTQVTTNIWWYDIHNRNGSAGPIRKLDSSGVTPPESDVLQANREPDFFELLKASINVGSIGKTATSGTPTNLPGGTTGSYQTQYNDDSRVDDAIIQIGANIIDQFDLDGYPTQISFNDGGSASGKEFRGVENLPYLSRVTHALVKVKHSVTKVANGTITSGSDTGVGALLQCPELWNPHDYNPNDINQSAGIAGPTKFRVYADTSANPVNGTITLLGFSRRSGNNHRDFADPNKSPGYQDKYGFTFGAPEGRMLSLANTELDFTVSRDAAGVARFREPTILFQLSSAGGVVDKSPVPGNFGTIASDASFFSGNAFKSDVGSGITGVPPQIGSGYVGFYIGAVPLCWYNKSSKKYVWTDEEGLASILNVNYYLQYQDGNNKWITYDQKYRTLGGSGSYSESATLCGGGDRSDSANGWYSFLYSRVISDGNGFDPWDSCYAAMDPRTSRFGLMKLTAGDATQRYWTYPPYAADSDTTSGISYATRQGNANRVAFTHGWIDPGKGITLPLRNGTNDGASLMCPLGLFPASMGWIPGTEASITSANQGRFTSFNNINSTGSISVIGNMICRPGMYSQNSPYTRFSNRAMGDIGDPISMDNALAVPGNPGPLNGAEYYTDPDGVVRRASGGLVPYDSTNKVSTSNTGLPMTAANASGVTRNAQSGSRPVILNRPFQTVGELGYTFSGTPWKNLDFNMPESGNSALLDVFCINDTSDPNGLVAGRVNLNTRQVPVLQAIISGAYRDEWSPGGSAMSSSIASSVANALLTRTTGTAAGAGSLQNVGELVGKWVGGYPTSSAGSSDPGVILPTQNPGEYSTMLSPRNYNGFSADLINNTVSPPTGVLVSDTNVTIQRFEEAALRALSSSGQTRVWNLMIDVIAQTGRYPANFQPAEPNALAKFIVEGEQHYWVHVAIDRFTGQVIDEQMEVVKE